MTISLARGLSPFPMSSYFLGTAFLGTGILGLLSPEQAQLNFGVVLASTGPRVASGPSTSMGRVGESPTPPSEVAYIYSKAGRDLALGATFVLLEARGHARTTAMFTGLMGLCGIVDGYAVWAYGGDELRHKAWVHSIGGVFLIGLAICKL
ncbi:hypothetical protein BX600DRAFT_476152 [Xylariales sp. PMI_506]|nr:hypothetical protein BX600DRAFT_476152 [Xylariales sp. PMI_506]